MRTTRHLLVIAVLSAYSFADAQTYYGSGYTIIEGAEPGQIASDLNARVFKTINAYNVEDGLRQLLAGSGWELAQTDNADPQIWRLYRQPWPENKRTINPMPLGEALSWIAGEGWVLVSDPVNRLVSFEINTRYAARPAPAVNAVTTTTSLPSSTTNTYPSGNSTYVDVPYSGSMSQISTLNNQTPTYYSQKNYSNSYTDYPPTTYSKPTTYYHDEIPIPEKQTQKTRRKKATTKVENKTTDSSALSTNTEKTVASKDTHHKATAPVDVGECLYMHYLAEKKTARNFAKERATARVVGVSRGA
ncbi:MAG: hypothetical protein Q4A74_08395, partial [Cardiobacteriaceae bacterium]|nr:hypothetical protein [Cardiobacteriaceae bacterium]